ncbi:ABC transporter ATP-binding protein [Blastococcus sp. SYSU DS0616]
MSGALLEARGLQKRFVSSRNGLGLAREWVHAVNDVSLTVESGQTMGVVGESGSGKSTLGRLLLRLIEADDGTIHFDGQDLRALRGRRLRQARADMQMVFQDPYASLDPTKMILDSVGEPLRVHRDMGGRQLEARVLELLELVGLGEHHLKRYPYEFSGGQRQRIAIARAVALDPRLVVADEPVSALDVSTQSQVINLMLDLQQRLGVAYVFISHDLSVVRQISDQISVMYLGRVVENGPSEEVYRAPRHPYTSGLLAAVPIPDPRRQRRRERLVLRGDAPDPSRPPSGCPFHPRCPHAMDVCRTETPPLAEVASGIAAACHLHDHGPRLQGGTVRDLETPKPRVAETLGGQR